MPERSRGSGRDVADDLLARIRLIRSSSIGPVTYRQLIARFDSAQAALDAIPDLARRGGSKPPRLSGIAGVSVETIAVEVAQRSGSLITARLGHSRIAARSAGRKAATS